MRDAVTEPRERVDDDVPPLEPFPPPAGPGARLAALRDSETAKALGLAIATMASNALAVVFTVVFARVLGTGGYGSLGALLNLSVILLVPGAALQVAAAREGTLGRLGQGAELAETLRRWMLHLGALALGLAVVSVVLRHQLAAVVNVEQEWAAAAVPLTGVAWLLLSVQRGLLQAARAYRAVALSVILEAFGRLVVGILLVLAGSGVTGAYLGTPLSMVLCAVALFAVLRRRLGRPDRSAPRHPLRALARDARYPIAGLTLVAALQNVDVIMAKHQLTSDEAGVYAATAVAGKAVVWIAVGVGLHLLPEATHRAAAGMDPRPALLRALGIIAVIALPALAIFAVVPELLLETAFGAEYGEGASVLLLLGVAYALLAATYLSVQYLLGLGWRMFLVPLAVAAAAEPIALLGATDLQAFGIAVLLVQLAAAAAVVAICLLARTARQGTT